MRGLVAYLLLLLNLFAFESKAQTESSVKFQFANGTMELFPLANNAVRVKYYEGKAPSMPEIIYVKDKAVPYQWSDKKSKATLQIADMTLTIDKKRECLSAYNRAGELVFNAYSHDLQSNKVSEVSTNIATMSWDSPKDEYIAGLGQFQDNYLNIRGLSRRLTQVNTQISIPLLISNMGYGVLWNNYGMTEFNPLKDSINLHHGGAIGQARQVSVSADGAEIQIRQDGAFWGVIDVPVDGDYSLLLDAGRKMASAHHLEVDGKVLIDAQNPWLPPTMSIIVPLKAGKHSIAAKLENWDVPSLYYELVKDNSTFRSPVAECVDYTIFVGGADQVVKSYRDLTGHTSLLPQWALGYVHCRERYKTQDELLQNAREFRKRGIPLDLIVQDWQYWGKHGWNAMRFDEDNYPDPAAMVKELHDMNMRLMISVWSKIDRGSELGKVMQDKGFYIDGTDWIDFFNPAAANFYWKSMSEKLLQPYKIDAWWQDATEPENDDLVGRRICNGKLPGELYRNSYPLMVCKTVYEGLRQDDSERRAMVFTRSAYTGAQRYGAVVWSGDVSWDLATLRKQIISGLGIASAGFTWWTYDAGGFFRVSDQYTNQEYIETMIRWVQASAFMPLMRIHGYDSNTEPWRYGGEAERIITDYIKLRYSLLPYTYSIAAKVSFDGYTLMRPLLFDFASDEEALKHDAEFMFGGSILVNPVTALGVDTYSTYLPQSVGGWYDYWSGEKYAGGQSVTSKVDINTIPIFVKGGSIIPFAPDRQNTEEKITKPLKIVVYPGADARFTLYEDEGDTYNYEDGSYSTIDFTWNEADKSLTISSRIGYYSGFMRSRQFIVTNGDKEILVNYIGDEMKIDL